MGAFVVAFRGAGVPRIEVWDTGPGIAPDDRTRVFEEYVQLANPERDRAQGLGLGLAIVKRLALLIGSDVSPRLSSGSRLPVQYRRRGYAADRADISADAL